MADCLACSSHSALSCFELMVLLSKRSSAGKKPVALYMPLSDSARWRNARNLAACSFLSEKEVMNSGWELKCTLPASDPVPTLGGAMTPRSSPSCFWNLVRLLVMAKAHLPAKNMFMASAYSSDVTSGFKTLASIICFVQDNHSA